MTPRVAITLLLAARAAIGRCAVDGQFRKQGCLDALANPLNDIRVVGEAQRAVGFEVSRLIRGHFHERDQLEQRRRVVCILDGQAMTGAAMRRALTKRSALLGNRLLALFSTRPWSECKVEVAWEWPISKPSYP
jgi:hypothetical protein